MEDYVRVREGDGALTNEVGNGFIVFGAARVPSSLFTEAALAGWIYDGDDEQGFVRVRRSPDPILVADENKVEGQCRI